MVKVRLRVNRNHPARVRGQRGSQLPITGSSAPVSIGIPAKEHGRGCDPRPYALLDIVKLFDIVFVIEDGHALIGQLVPQQRSQSPAGILLDARRRLVYPRVAQEHCQRHVP